MFFVLVEAVKGQHLDIVELLIKTGCNMNAAEIDYEHAPVHVAVREGWFLARNEGRVKILSSVVRSVGFLVFDTAEKMLCFRQHASTSASLTSSWRW